MWEMVKLAQGSEVLLYYQDPDLWECGPACIAMYASLIGKSVGSVDRIRNAVREVDGEGIHRGFDLGWKKKTGTFIDKLKTAMANLGISTLVKETRTTLGLKQAMCALTHSKPGIIQVTWADEPSSHFVLCVGRNGNQARDFVEILDPICGLQKIDEDCMDERMYAPVLTSDHGNVQITSRIHTKVLVYF